MADTKRQTVGATEYILVNKLNDREGEFWTPAGDNSGDPDYSFSQKVADDGSTTKVTYVHVTTKGAVDALPDWTKIPTPAPPGPCITIFSVGTVTAYRMSEVTAQPIDGTGMDPSSPASSASFAASQQQQPAEAKPIAVYAPTQMCPDPPLVHCWAPKLDRLRGKYFFVNCENRSKVWVLPEVTDITSRVKAMFRRYAPSRLSEVETLVKEHQQQQGEDGGSGSGSGGNKNDELMKKLIDQYGAEPGVIEARTRERLVAIFAKYDRAKLDDFEDLLHEHTGKEEDLIQDLLKTYNAPKEPPTYRQRIMAMYEKYPPKDPVNVDETLRVYHGKELQFIVALVRRYGPEPLVEYNMNKSDEERRQWLTRAVRIYQKYAPEKLSGAPQALSFYKGFEEIMLEVLTNKYGVEPSASEPLPPIDPALLAAIESAGSPPASPRDGGAQPGVPAPQSGEPVNVTPLDQNSNSAMLSAQQQGELQAQQQQSAIALLTDMEERLKGAYARLEDAHEKAEALRNENLRLHEYSNKVMQDNDVITQELRRALAASNTHVDEVKQQCEHEKERLQQQHAAETAQATQQLQQELLKAEQEKLNHSKILSELSAKHNEAEESKSEATVQTQYLRQRCTALERDIEEAKKAVDELKNRLREKDDVCHRAMQTGGDDVELRGELRARRMDAQRELDTINAEAQHWRSLASRLETELRAAERKREEIERNCAEEIDKATGALNQTRELNLALEDRVACLEAELLATPSAGGATMVGEHDLRAKVNDLQRELADAHATIRGQRKQANDLRGLLAMHMAQSPPVSKGAALSPTAQAQQRGSPASASRRPPATSASSASRATPGSGGIRR